MLKKLMKKALAGTGIVLMLAALLPASPAAAAADAAWAEEVIPNIDQHVLAPAGMDIRDMDACGSSTFYAAPGSSFAGNAIYKTTNTGNSWQEISTPFQADLVAVSPSNASIIAIANTATGQVGLSTNSGEQWYDLGVPQQGAADAATAIYDIDVSPVYDGRYYIAAAGTESSGSANMWYYNTGAAAAAWEETNTAPGISGANQTAAVAFSPHFATDKTIIVITEQNGVSVRLQAYKLSSDNWNSQAGLNTYPVTITTGGSITTLDAASLSLAPAFDASSVNNRIAFVGLAMSGGGGIYRVRYDTMTALKTDAGIRSVAYDGSRLVAGAYNSADVFRSTDALMTTPTFTTTYAGKLPGGTSRVVVAWAGSNIAAGTSGAQSAFAVSTDYGSAFNDIGLIDTTITTIGGIAVSEDSDTLYMLSADASHLSLWRRITSDNDAVSWARVYNRLGDADYILQTDPDNANVIYLAEKDGTTIHVNMSRGNDRWQIRNSPLNVRDVAVVGINSLYVLGNNGSVAESHDAGFTWTNPLPTGLNSGASIYAFDTNKLVVGSRDGYVAYSTDGNANWTRIPDIVEDGAGTVQVTTSSSFEENRYIYAASDTAGGNIMRWNIDASNDWQDIIPNSIPGGVYGLSIYEETFYALEYDATTGQSALWRHLAADSARADDDDDAWSRTVTTTTTDTNDPQVHLDLKPRGLWAREDKIWTVKTNGVNKLYSFTDINVTIKAGKPATGAIVQVNPISGEAHSAVFTWARPADVVTGYELQIARDKDFNIRLVSTVVTSPAASVSVIVGPKQTGTTHYDFFTGETYYWRVRAILPVYSPYSEPRSFTVEPVAALHAPQLLTPAAGATIYTSKPAFSWEPISGASGYNFVLSANADLSTPLIETVVEQPAIESGVELTPGTYYWRIKSAANEESIWSTLAYFNVEEAVATAPMITINGPGEVAPPEIIQSPATGPTTIVPKKLIPDSILKFAIYFGILLALAIMIIIFRSSGPLGLPAGFGNRLSGLGGGLGNWLNNLDPRRLRLRGSGLKAPTTPAAATASAGGTTNATKASRKQVAPAAAERPHEHEHLAIKPKETVTNEDMVQAAPAATAPGTKPVDITPEQTKTTTPPAPPTHDAEVIDVAETGRSLAFAVESFLWMTQEEKGDGQRMLASEELVNTGRRLAAKIRALAERTILYISFPRQTAMFLRLWSLYGSREETNRYLTETFLARPESVPALLRCYLPADAGAETEFGRAQYEAIGESVDTEEVYKVLTGIYGSQLNSLGDTETSPERTIAARFARIHLALRSKTVTRTFPQSGHYNT